MSTGAPGPSDRNSLTIGPDGRILLHDAHFLEQMAHFNREKVDQRRSASRDRSRGGSGAESPRWQNRPGSSCTGATGTPRSSIWMVC
ncbi:MAG TPA: catalase [Acetobacteraceae bacterium]